MLQTVLQEFIDII